MWQAQLAPATSAIAACSETTGNHQFQSTSTIQGANIGICALVSQCPALDTLDLTHCGWLTHASVLHLGSCAHALARLVLPGHALCDDVAHALARSSTSQLPEDQGIMNNSFTGINDSYTSTAGVASTGTDAAAAAASNCSSSPVARWAGGTVNGRRCWALEQLSVQGACTLSESGLHSLAVVGCLGYPSISLHIVVPTACRTSLLSQQAHQTPCITLHMACTITA